MVIASAMNEIYTEENQRLEYENEYKTLVHETIQDDFEDLKETATLLASDLSRAKKEILENKQQLKELAQLLDVNNSFDAIKEKLVNQQKQLAEQSQQLHIFTQIMDNAQALMEQQHLDAEMDKLVDLAYKTALEKRIDELEHPL